MQPILTNLSYPEGPRWHQNKLWFSDIFLRELKTLDLQGKVETVVHYDDELSGIGWQPNGTLCVVSVFKHQLLRWENGQLCPWVDIDDGNSFASNDMVISANGNAYIGNISFDYTKDETPKPCNIKLVTPDGKMQIAASDLQVPNGMVITPDGKTLITAESYGDRLTAFTINTDGTLCNQRVLATLPTGAVPDGICLDAEMCVWVACNQLCAVLRVNPAGEVIDKIEVPSHPLACMLGGPDRKTLFILTTATFDPEIARRDKGGKIYSAKVNISGAGLP